MNINRSFKAQLLNRRLHKRIKSSKKQQSTLNSIYNSSRKHQGKKIKMTLFNDGLPILKKHRNIPETKEQRIDDLSEDLLAGILVRLPVKYILRCRCVQKSWYNLIQTPMFITLQINQQKTIARDRNSKYLYFDNTYTNVLTVRFDDVQCQEYCKIKYLPGLPEHAWWRAISNGLICTTTFFYSSFSVDNNIYLWNPLVEKYKTLPDSPLSFNESKWEALAFGFVPEINDYVVVHVVKPCLHLACVERDPHSVFVGVYSLNANSWKKLSQDDVFVCDISYKDVVFVNGAAFWIGNSSDCRKIMLCYDTKSDMLRVISLPEYVADCPCIPVIHPFGQSSIAYFLWGRTYIRAYADDYFDMWVLKYDSVNEFSWEKKMSIRTSKHIERFHEDVSYEIVSYDIRAEVLGIRNNGEPILARLYDLLSYNLDNNEAEDFVDSWDSWTPYPYYELDFAPPFFVSPFVETLALLNID